MNTCRIALATSFIALAGCTSMSGLTGSSTYACQAPEGVTCASVSGTYANALQDNLPSRRALAAKSGPPPAGVPLAVGTTSRYSTQDTARPGAADAALASPLRSSPRVLRLWIKPWEDTDQDLHDQGYVYVQIDGGRWLVEHVQRRIRDARAPLRPPTRTEPATDAKESPNDPTRSPKDQPQSPGFSIPTGRPGAPH